MINDDAHADHEPQVNEIDELFEHIKAQQKMISRIITLNESMMRSLEDHKLRIGRLEYMLANNKAKRVSRNPGDREA